MADKQRNYVIRINGISESISQIDSLISKIDSLSQKIDSLNKHGISIQASGGGGSAASSQVQQAQQVEVVQKEITVEVTRQREVIADQTTLMKENLGVQSEALQIANSLLGSYDSNLTKLSEYKSQLEQIKQQRKDIDASVKAGTMSEEEAASARRSLLDTELQIKQAKSETERIMKNEVKLSQSQAGSYDQMSYTLSRLKDALKVSNSGSLSAENFEKISRAVSELDQELKRGASSMGEWQRNVGNYAQAVEGISKIKVEIAGTVKEFDSAKSAIMELKNAMAQLVMSGQQGTEAYKALENQMQNLQLAMVTVNDSIDRAKDASSGLHTAVEALQGLTAIAGIGQGLSSLFGIDDGALGEQIKKLTSLMAIMQGLQQLATSMATGTGIGSALKKVLDISGINNDWKQFKEGLTVIGQKLGIVKVQAEGAAVGFSAMAASAKVAEAAVKGIGRALLIGFAIEAVVWAIELLVDGFKALYDVCHDWISMSDDVSRANKALETSLDSVADMAKLQAERIDDAVGRGVISEYDAIIEKQNVLTNAIAQTVSEFKSVIDTQERAGNIHPQLADWEKINAKADELNKRMLNGEDVANEWNGLMSTVLNDIAARVQNLDTSDKEALKNFSEWISTAPIAQRAMEYFGDAGKDATDAVGNGFISATEKISPLLDKLFQVNGELSKMQNEFDTMLEKAQYWDKYGNLNQYNIDKANNRATGLAGTPGITGGTEANLALIKKFNEAQYREHTTANRKRVASAKKTAYELVNIEKQIQADKLAAMRDGLTKTLATIEQERRARLEEIKKYPAAKQEEARNAANARYDKARNDARKEANDKYVEEEYQFRNKLRSIYSQLLSDKAEADDFFNRQEQTNNTLKESNLYYSQALNGWRNELMRISVEVDKYDQAIKKLKHDYLDVISLTEKNIELSPELSKRYEEYKKKLGDLNEEYEKAKKHQQTFDNTQLLLHKPDKYQEEGAASANFKLMMDYLFESLSQEEQYYKRRRDLQEKEINERERLAKAEAEEQFRVEQDALIKRWEAFTEDEEALKTHYLTEEEMVEFGERSKTEQEIAMQNIRERASRDYNNEMAQLAKAGEEQITAIEKKYQNERLKNEEDYRQEDKRIYESLHSGRLNELEKFYTSVNKTYADIQKMSTTTMGTIDIPKLLGTGKKAIKEYEGMLKSLDYALNGLLSDAAKNSIDPVYFNNTYSQLVELKKKIKETIQEIHDSMNAGDIWKSFDEWIQNIASSFQQVLSAIFEYQNGEFDRMQEAIDKELELVQKKYDEMEELAQKHKDAMNEIEDELSTARGDRRQHLIDALSAEIQAQREALAKQKKAEKEKERLEKRSDQLELQRKKAQRKQDMIQVALNTALAISQAMTNKWPIPALVLAALAAAMGAAQLSIMAKTHYRDGGLLSGPDHEHGGVPLNNRAVAEGGEYVINKRTTSKNLPLIDFVNSSKKKLSLDDFIEFYSGDKKGQRLFGVRGKFEDGGLLPNPDLAERLVNVVIDRDTRPIYVSVVDINKVSDRMRNVEILAGK